jgi:DNA-binding MarR family transcriptional regulator/N-acetylglutamate synthase-like GNAT family acetyltransferase
MMQDILAEGGHLFLGSRLKRLGERMQADVSRVVAAAGLPIQPSQYPILAALDLYGPMTVGAAAETLGLSQPAITRALSRLVDLGLVASSRGRSDQRRRTIALTAAGEEAMACSKREVWPRIDAAVAAICAPLDGPLLDQLAAIERDLAATPLDRRAAAVAAPDPSIRDYSDDLAGAFHDINVAWIEAMFTLEPTDRDVLENPRARIIDRGGAILFAETADLGVVGTCALQKTGEGRIELIKMAVLESARGRKIGEFLLRATIDRAAAMGAETLYLLTNSACAPAIHLYEKAGFVHDEAIMRDFGARYARCDVAMRYRPPSQGR